MSQLEKEKTEIPCPGGGSSIRTTYGEVARKSSLRSSRGHEYKFKSSDQSKLRRAQKEFFEAFQNVIANADILLKR